MPVPTYRLQDAIARARQALDRDDQKAAAIELLWSRKMLERAVELLTEIEAGAEMMDLDDAKRTHIQAWLAKFTRGPLGL